MPYTLDLSKISLTTVQGYLALASKFALAAGGSFGMGGYLKTASAFGVVYILIGAAQAVVGTLQQDAGKQLAIPPGGGVPETMPSHETPDAPGAKAVTK